MAGYFTQSVILICVLLKCLLSYGQLVLFMPEEETQKLLGVETQVMYLYKIYKQDHALRAQLVLNASYNQHVLYWQNTSPDKQMQYGIEFLFDYPDGLVMPIKLNISSSGVIPTQLSAMMMTFNCTGSRIAVQIRMRLNITGWLGDGVTSVVLNRKKICVAGGSAFSENVGQDSSTESATSYKVGGGGVNSAVEELEPSTQPPTTSEEVTRPGAAAFADDWQCFLSLEGSNSTVFPDGVVSVPMNRSTGKAVVDLRVYQVNAKFTQPFGQHSFTLTSGDKEVNVNVNVYDPAVVRRLIFQAKYSLRCNLLERGLSRHFIEITARGGLHHIREICDGDCSDLADPQSSCANDTATIEWLTNVTYSAHVTTIPHQLDAKLSENIRNKRAILSLGMFADNQYSVELPIPDGNGLSLRPMLHSGCADDSMIYDSTLDRCLGD